MLPWIFYIIAFLYGISVGSFLNVCIWRIPRGESLARPGSHCPDCGHPLGIFDLFPLFSFLALKGRCRYCRGKISRRYPLVEFICGLLFALVVWVYGLTWEAVYYAAFAAMLLAVSFIDLDCMIIPNLITYPGMVLGIAVPWLLNRAVPWENLGGLALGGGLLYAVAWLCLKLLKKEGMGGGDIKLLAMIGAFTGPREVLATVFLASFFGSAAGIWLFIWKKLSKGRIIPFGPFLALAAMILILWGDYLFYWFGRYIKGGYY
ncbi:MAG: prepilin peptidase [Bacillota bacterium]